MDTLEFGDVLLIEDFDCDTPATATLTGGDYLVFVSPLDFFECVHVLV